jgi:Lon protease-like protein
VSSIDIPLFPLQTVLFPDGYLKLRIFEQRYIDMVRECSLRDCSFGVCLVGNTEDGTQPANHMKVGTTADICDFATLEDGLLGITAHGGQKFIVQKTRMRDNGLLMAEVETLDETATVEVPDKYALLTTIAGRFMEHLGNRYPAFHPQQLQDAHWVGYRLSEFLPLENHEKQLLLQLSDPLERLQILVDVLPRFQEPAET